MLTSLFGDLGPPRDPSKKTRPEADTPDQGFAATAILESMATEVNDQGKMVDRHQHDLVVSGSPAQAIRDHFATTRADLETASRLITLLDPVGIWASAVIKALELVSWSSTVTISWPVTSLSEANPAPVTSPIDQMSFACGRQATTRLW